jgi:hypothetical protein
VGEIRIRRKKVKDLELLQRLKVFFYAVSTLRTTCTRKEYSMKNIQSSKLIKYVVEEPGVLTLTCLLESGETVVVPISRKIAEEMTEDISYTISCRENPENFVPVTKITGHIDLQNDAIGSREVEEERA